MASREVPAVVRERVQPLLAALLPVHGEGLRSAIAYGPGVESGELRPSVAVQVLVLLDDASAATLRRTSPQVGQLRRRGVEPTFMAAAEFAASLDVFPLEFLDMQADYVVAHGQDVLADLNFEPAALRLQLEEALRGAYHWLRQEVGRRGHHPREMRRILAESFSSLVPAWRGLAALSGEGVPRDVDALLTAAATAYGLDQATLDSLRRLELGAVTLEPDEVWALTDAYDALLAGLLAKVDQLELAAS